MRSTLALLVLSIFCQQATAQKADTVACNRVLATAFERKLIDRPMGDVVAAIGRQFIGSPYEASTLDRFPEERLVTNLHTFDCVTFVENSLALARTVKRNHLAFGSYADELQQLRYRHGVIDGYTSRLHYFTEWIAANERKGLVRNMTPELGGERYAKELHFMTKHREAYAGLRNDSSFQQLRAIEDSLASLPLTVIPKENIRSVEKKIRTGDIIAVATSVEGLDVTHTGIAVRLEDGSLHLLHAPDVGKTVTVTDATLSSYISGMARAVGIIVCRPVEPQ
jgi:hypothetical protein